MITGSGGQELLGTHPTMDGMLVCEGWVEAQTSQARRGGRQSGGFHTSKFC